MVDFLSIEREIQQAMQADRFRLAKQVRALGQATEAGKPIDRLFTRLRDELDESVKRCQSRREGLPRVSYDDSLPIVARREEIAAAIRDHQVVVVSGETGSGKSTQLPKICLELGRGTSGMIGHTQPRRIAARSIAARVAEELSVPLGREVGFKIRFADSTSPRTYVKLMTDGILLAETQHDRFLDQYDTIILDEAHERSLNIDFLIGYLKRLLPKRPELKLIITSATLETARFARHFRTAAGPAPVIEVSGRAYPVEVFYRPLEPNEEGEEPELEDAVLAAVDDLARVDSGDMLIFMPTERHIHDMAKALRGHRLPGDAGQTTQVLPLYARLPTGEQQRIFQPHAHRRIVIATNVAESSLTVPGIRYVIDPGTARISRYSPRSKTQRLPIEAISQASADQRKGRCGRVGPGVCIRLYSEADYLARDRYTPPEILRSNLAAVILQTKALGLGPIEKFPFLEPPKPAAIRDGYRTLFELGAIDESNNLTAIGQRLARLPVDPRIGRMILAAAEENCLAEVLIIAAALEIRDPRDRPLEKQEKADAKHAQFADGNSDFLSYLNLWDFYHGLKQKLSRNQLTRACRENFLSSNRMREWLDIHRQLLQLVGEAGLKPGPRRDDYNSIHRAIVTGLLANLAYRNESYEYTAAGGTRFFLWPGSGTFEKKPKWVVAAELVETSKRYLRTVARIDPGWVEPMAMHLVKRYYSDPQWHAESGSAVALEKVTLFGLPIVPQRRVAYGPINPEHARQMLIQSGLVEGQLETNAPFLRHNQELYRQMERLEAKLRRHDLLLGEWNRYEFYDARLPADVYDLARLNRWRRDVEKDQPRLLFMTEADLVREAVDESVAAAFPDTLPVEHNELPLDYRFEPGSQQDGVTLTVPVEAVNQLDPERLNWVVPGVLERKVTALIKSLPKPIRRNLVPAPDTARQVVGRLRFAQGSLLSALSAELARIAGQAVPVEAFDLDRLPEDLRMNVRVVDAQGAPLATGRDLVRLRRELKQETSAGLATIEDDRWTRDGIAAWDLDELPEETEVRRGALVLKAYPMLMDRGDSVAIRLTDSLRRAEHETRHGLRRLFFLACRRELKTQVDWLPGLAQMAVHAASLRGFELRLQLAELLADRAFVAGQPIVRTKGDFERRLAEGRQRIVPAVQDVAELAGPLFEAYHQAQLALEQAPPMQWEYAVVDMKAQLARLMHASFLTRTPWNWLQHYPRYLRAIPLRLDKLRSGGLARDRDGTADVVARQEAYFQRLRQHEELDLFDPEMEQYRWMLEEYRVSLFAQQLGTAMAISGKRLDRQWEKVKEE